jgi:hypothetical protein
MECTIVQSNEEKISPQCVRRGLIELSTMSNGSTNRRSISFVIVMASLDPVSLAWQQRAASRYSKRPTMRLGRMRFVNGFWGACGENVSITFSSSRRSSWIVSFRPTSSTSIKPDRIKASNNKSQNNMVSLFLRITMLARFSPSPFWVDYTTITAKVLELLRVC